ncbi:hypothetical protein [Streptomyces sp. NPDC006552]|uniref:hypothetical protein n=1 Tax=Streptomyces sp. NPDC006552 TaxID=3157179 RepID=UPI0033A44A64
MSAPTHPRTHPSAAGRAETRLPWWALLLPAVAFAALLLLILNPADAQAPAGDPTLAHLAERLKELVLG